MTTLFLNRNSLSVLLLLLLLFSLSASNTPPAPPQCARPHEDDDEPIRDNINTVCALTDYYDLCKEITRGMHYINPTNSASDALRLGIYKVGNLTEAALKKVNELQNTKDTKKVDVLKQSGVYQSLHSCKSSYEAKLHDTLPKIHKELDTNDENDYQRYYEDADKRAPKRNVDTQLIASGMDAFLKTATRCGNEFKKGGVDKEEIELQKIVTICINITSYYFDY